MRLNVERSPTLVAAIRLIAAIPNEAAKQIRQHSKAIIQPEWKKGLAERAPGERIFHERLVGPSAAYVSDRNVQLKAGRAGKFPRETEFGAYREDFNDYTRRAYSRRHPKSGTTFRVDGGNVHRRTQRQFRHYRKDGHVVYPTARDMIPRIAALWISTIRRTVHEQIEKIR